MTRDYKTMIGLVPEPLQEAMLTWIEKGEPHPSKMHRLFREILSNNLVETAYFADEYTALQLKSLAEYLRRYAPHECWRHYEVLECWHERHHPATPPLYQKVRAIR